MASVGSLSAAYHCTAILPWKKPRVYQPFQVRARSYSNEGSSKNVVDDNICVLRERIEEVKMKERMERCCLVKSGWNYPTVQNFRVRKDQELVRLVGTLVATCGLTVITCTFCLCIVSTWVHLSQ